MRSHAFNCAGVTLAEVLIAMLLFSLGMIGIFGVSTAMRSMSMLSNSVSEATLLGGNTMETLRARIDAGASLTSSNSVSGPYTVAWVVSTNAGCQARQVRVSVAWTDMRAQSHSVAIKSILEP